MTGVTTRTLRDARGAEALLSGCLGVAVLWCGVLVLRADRRAPRHGLWRDPLSWFASDEAPDPSRLRFGLMVVAVLLVLLAVVGFVRRRPLAPTLITLTAGALVAGIALAPLDCSIRFDYCEKLVVAGLVSDAHIVHVVLAGALVLLAVLATVAWARRSRSAVAVVGAFVVAGAAAAMFVAPTWENLGTLQFVVLGGGAVATARLWRSAPTLVSPP